MVPSQLPARRCQALLQVTRTGNGLKGSFGFDIRGDFLTGRIGQPWKRLRSGVTSPESSEKSGDVALRIGVMVTVLGVG